jgi:hypothetical protein
VGAGSGEGRLDIYLPPQFFLSIIEIEKRKEIYTTNLYPKFEVFKNEQFFYPEYCMAMNKINLERRQHKFISKMSGFFRKINSVGARLGRPYLPLHYT